MFPAQSTVDMGFGQAVNRPTHKEGFCEVAHVAELAKACGAIAEDGDALPVSTLPFSAFCRRDGQKWQLRIERPNISASDGAVGFTCHWVFAQAAGALDLMR